MVQAKIDGKELRKQLVDVKNELQATSGKTADGTTVRSFMPTAYRQASKGMKVESDWSKWYNAAIKRLDDSTFTEQDVQIIRAIIKFNQELDSESVINMSDIQADDEDQQESTFADTMLQELTEKTSRVSKQISQPIDSIEFTQIDMSKLANVSRKYDHTQEQREMLNMSLADQSVLMKNLKTIDPQIQQSANVNEPRIIVDGQAIPVSKFNAGINKLAERISLLSGNLSKPLLKSYQTKKSAFSKIAKQEQTKFKPTLGQLFQTRSVMC